jgi:hypothetical protein
MCRIAYIIDHGVHFFRHAGRHIFNNSTHRVLTLIQADGMDEMKAHEDHSTTSTDHDIAWVIAGSPSIFGKCSVNRFQWNRSILSPSL